MTVNQPIPLGEISIRGDSAEVRRSSLWLEEACHRRNVPADQIMRLNLCLNEALANVISHGGPKALNAPIHLRLSLEESTDQQTAVLSIVDSGACFDPDDTTAKPAPSSLSEAEPGGLGLIMMRSFADELNYHREEEQNRLMIIVRWPFSK
jgi:anti-sigma regulatory factor (Ser/Thr protein kinase)